MAEQNYLTAERIKELKQELEGLKTDKRVEVADRLKKAKELGDLSENAEYAEAREEQARVESRIFELEELIRHAKVVKKGQAGTVVRVGSTVKARRDGKDFTFTIVGSNETRPEEGFISNESPLGAAFLEKKSGDEVIVKAPAGSMKYKIVSIH